MLISALVGAVVVVVLLMALCCCYKTCRLCTCDCSNYLTSLMRSRHNPADECKDPQPRYSLNVEDFYGGKAPRHKEMIDSDQEQASTDGLQMVKAPKRAGTFAESIDNSHNKTNEASFYVVKDHKASMMRTNTQKVKTVKGNNSKKIAVAPSQLSRQGTVKS